MSGSNEKYRLQSLDIFRGITIAAMILVNTPGNGDNVYAPLEHSGMDFFYSQVFLPFLSPKNASLAGAFVFVAFIWLLMYPLYRKNILIKL